MGRLELLLERNRAWVSSRLAADAQFFVRLRDGQSPKTLFIGCSDSRVTPETILGAGLGDVFVDRNVGNLVKADDAALMSVLEYGIQHLGVEDLVVCGHYGCGAVAAAMSDAPVEPFLDRWIEEIRELWRSNRKLLETIQPHARRVHLMEVLNVLSQAVELAALDLVRQARARSGRPAVHAWIFFIPDGRVVDLGQLIDLERPLVVDEALLGRIAQLHDSLGVHGTHD